MDHGFELEIGLFLDFYFLLKSYVLWKFSSQKWKGINEGVVHVVSKPIMILLLVRTLKAEYIFFFPYFC